MSVRTRIVIAVSCATPLACALVTDLSSLSGDAGDAAPTCEAGSACVAANVPATWRPIAYHEGFVGCPTGFTSEKYVTKPVGACACGCTMTAQPRCDVGQMQTYFGSGPGCASTGLSNSFNGNCAQISGPLATYFAAKPLQPSGGTCTSTALPDDASTVNAEACIPQQCADAICEGVVPPGYKACVISDGDIPCPSGTPFSVRTTVGASASVVCGAGCLCAVSATCSNPKVEFFTDQACKTSLVTLPADGTCVTSGENGVVVGSAKYTATLDASCSGSGAPEASTSLVAPRTVCCAP